MNRDILGKYLWNPNCILNFQMHELRYIEFISKFYWVISQIHNYFFLALANIFANKTLCRSFNTLGQEKLKVRAQKAKQNRQKDRHREHNAVTFQLGHKNVCCVLLAWHSVFFSKALMCQLLRTCNIVVCIWIFYLTCTTSWTYNVLLNMHRY